MNDRERVENAIIPALLIWMIKLILRDAPEQRAHYKKAQNILQATLDDFLDVKPEKKRLALIRRLKRVCNKIEQYYLDNKFDTRKGIIMLTIWAFKLDEQDALAPISEEYCELLHELDNIFAGGFNQIDNFDKIFNSATKHIPKVHDLVQKEGYL